MGSQVADAFIELQQARHVADYDLSNPFRRRQVLDLVGQARDALLAWRSVRDTEPASVFLVALFAFRHMRKS